jgi:hypothetical protein
MATSTNNSQTSYANSNKKCDKKCDKKSDKLFSEESYYGQGVIDNGEKWGSFVKREKNGSIPFDEKLFKENNLVWNLMMNERMSWLNNKGKINQINQTATKTVFVLKKK